MARVRIGSGAGTTKGSMTKGAPDSKGGREPKGAKRAASAEKVSRIKQIRTVFTLTRQRDPRLVPALLIGFLVPVVVGVIIGLLLGPLVLWIIIGVLLGALVALNVFGRRVQRSAYAEAEGKPGAAAGIVERMRGDWRVTAPVQVNRNQDMVTRVVSRAGVVLIAEGRGRGPRELLGAEVRRVKRVVGDVPLHDIVIGTGEGETPLPKLQALLMRKTRALKKSDVDSLDRRLKALGGVSIPVPKGPMPRSIPRGGRMR